MRTYCLYNSTNLCVIHIYAMLDLNLLILILLFNLLFNKKNAIAFRKNGKFTETRKL